MLINSIIELNRTKPRHCSQNNTSNKQINNHQHLDALHQQRQHLNITPLTFTMIIDESDCDTISHVQSHLNGENDDQIQSHY